jgi:hypothetical protein
MIYIKIHLHVTPTKAGVLPNISAFPFTGLSHGTSGPVFTTHTEFKSTSASSDYPLAARRHTVGLEYCFFICQGISAVACTNRVDKI